MNPELARKIIEMLDKAEDLIEYSSIARMWQKEKDALVEEIKLAENNPCAVNK